MGRASTHTVDWVDLSWRLGAMAFLILANAFFVVSEFALTRARQFDEEEFQGHPGLERAWQMTEKLEYYLTGCQLGISSTSVILGVVAEPAMTALIAPVVGLVGISGGSVRVTSVVVGIILINLIHKIWGEQTPTYLGVERPQEVARYTAIPLYVWCKATWPLIKAGDGLAKLTLRMFGVRMTRSWAQEEGAGEGGDLERQRADSVRTEIIEVLSRARMPSDRRQEVVAAIEIDDIPVREIMVPHDEVAMLDADAPFEDNLRVMAEHTKTRYPLVRGGLDRTIGVIYAPALFARLGELRSGEVTLADLAVPAVSVAAECPVAGLIDRLQAEEQELALVREDDRVCGVVTITDAFEAIAGQVEDPYDSPGQPGATA